MNLYILFGLFVGGALGFALYKYLMYAKFKKEMELYKDAELEVKKDFGKVLVVFYSYSGNTKYIAEKIAKKTKADLYEIKTLETYNSAKILFTSKNQIRTKNYPEIEQDFPNLADYDMVFVGSPVWWYTVSPAVLAYLSQTDFLDKKVAVFNTHGGNEGKFSSDFAANAKNADIVGSIDFFNAAKMNKSLVDKKVSVWVNKF